jgi:hypothetical protein
MGFGRVRLSGLEMGYFDVMRDGIDVVKWLCSIFINRVFSQF